MALDLSDLKKYAGLLGKGFIIEMAPEIAKGVLIEVLRAKGVNVKNASDWVQNNTNLWKSLEPEEQALLKDLAERAGNTDWFDTNWVIEAIKNDFPAIASLFLGWKKGNNWLARQVEVIKKEVSK